MIKVATRKSPLALIQAKIVCEHLSKVDSNLKLQLYPMSTEIDSRLDYSIEKQGGMGLFTKELDIALLDKNADIAVHSSKDLPIVISKSLSVAAYIKRDSALDVLVSKLEKHRIKTIATNSPRRRSQLESIFPEAKFLLIRGNVETRLKKILHGDADATILAVAGLNRLGIHKYKGLFFTPLEKELMVPAAGQGAIAIVCRNENLGYFRQFNCTQTYEAVTIEKECLKILDGGCQSPAGVYFDGDNLHLYHPSLGFKVYNLESDNLGSRVAKAGEIIKSIKEGIIK